MKRHRRRSIRDQSGSPFTSILERLCNDSGALAAALVDAEGEAVDYFGVFPPYETRVAAAEWRIVLSVVNSAKVPGFRHVTGITVRAQGRTFMIEALPDGYAVALVLPRRSFQVSRRAMAQALRELAREAGLPMPEARAEVRWARVTVRTPPGARVLHRPDAIWLAGAWSPLTILGRYEARDREVGYLARLATGAEVFLVREPLGAWFIDNSATLEAANSIVPQPE